MTANALSRGESLYTYSIAAPPVTEAGNDLLPHHILCPLILRVHVEFDGCTGVNDGLAAGMRGRLMLVQHPEDMAEFVQNDSAFFGFGIGSIFDPAEVHGRFARLGVRTI